jgi:catechol 2,3-dioxygenase-like lactoylglutathione lyase family enzyme
MKRLHVHVAVDDIAKAVAFYSSLFGATPTKEKDDYAKWRLEDPRVNFAISARGQAPGVQHLGIEAESSEELAEVYERASAADATLAFEGETVCCYARSEKGWATDPAGVSWELFHTFGDSPEFGGKVAGNAEVAVLKAASRCAPKETSSACC